MPQFIIIIKKNHTYMERSGFSLLIGDISESLEFFIPIWCHTIFFFVLLLHLMTRNIYFSQYFLNIFLCYSQNDSFFSFFLVTLSSASRSVGLDSLFSSPLLVSLVIWNENKNLKANTVNIVFVKILK